MLTTLTYVEGGAMFRERGGSSTFARHAFNELITFIAGWAILIDYLIVVALAAISVPHYLAPISADLAEPGWEIGVAGAGDRRRLRCSTSLNITGRGRAAPAGGAGARRHRPAAGGDRRRRARRLPPRPRSPTSSTSSPSPSLKDIVYAAVVAMLAYAGIEAASDLAPDIDVEPRDLKRIVSVGRRRGAARLRRDGGDRADGGAGRRRARTGPQTALGGDFVEAPVLGVVSAFHPAWVADAMRWVVALVAAPVLFWAATTAMLGVSRHIYTLATNRQIPSWLGKLNAPLRDPARGDRDLAA